MNPSDHFTIRLTVRGEGVVKPVTKLTLNLYIFHQNPEINQQNNTGHTAKGIPNMYLVTIGQGPRE